MPPITARRGLNWYEHSRTWHYEFRFKASHDAPGRNHNDDTGHVREGGVRTQLAAFNGRLKSEAVGLHQAVPSVLTLSTTFASSPAPPGPPMLVWWTLTETCS